jgi:hypothetical protein
VFGQARPPVYLKGEVAERPRQSFFCISEDGDSIAIRLQDWKAVLTEQRAKQLACWMEPFAKLRIPKIFHLRRDPFQRADESLNTHHDGLISHAYLTYVMQAVVAGQIENFVMFPPRRKPASHQPGGGDARAGCGRQRQTLTGGWPASAASTQARHGLPCRNTKHLCRRLGDAGCEHLAASSLARAVTCAAALLDVVCRWPSAARTRPQHDAPRRTPLLGREPPSLYASSSGPFSATVWSRP